MRVKAVLLFSVIAVSSSLVGLSFFTPPRDDLWFENPFWNGLSKVYSRLEPVRLQDLMGVAEPVVEPSGSTVLMLGPSRMFTPFETVIVNRFLHLGGRVVLADEFGTGNSLLERLGLDVRFSGLLLLDPLFKDGSSRMPRILNVSSVGVDELVLNYPTVLDDADDLEVLAWSTSFSYLAVSPGPPDEDSVYGPFPVAAEVGVGDGSLVLIADSSLFINSMLDRGDNMEFLLSLVEGEVFLDEAHSIPSRLTMVKAFLVQVYSVLRMTEVKYGLAALSMIAVARVKWVVDEAEEEEDEVEAVLRRHPEWDRGLLEWLHEERRWARGGR